MTTEAIMDNPPEVIYFVQRVSSAKKPYYGRRDARLYSGRNGVVQFIGSNPDDEFRVHALTPLSDWLDVTERFTRA